MKKWTGYTVIIQGLICAVLLSLYIMPSVVINAGRANDIKRVRAWPVTVQSVADVYAKGHDGQAYRAIAMDSRRHFYTFNYYGIQGTAPLYMWLYKAYPDNNHAEISHPLSAGDAPVLIVNYHDKPEYITAFQEDFEKLEELPPIEIELGGGITRTLRLWAGYDYTPTKTRGLD